MMNDDEHIPLTWGAVYRRHRQVWIGLAFFIIAVVVMVGYAIYSVWFVPLGSKPLISSYVITKIVEGAIVGWFLTALSRKK